MNNGKNQVNTINWMAVFSFSHIFKSFRIAIHPSKMLLGLAAVISIYVFGVAMDGAWDMFGSRVPEGDILNYVCKDGLTYAQDVKTANEGKPQKARDIKSGYREERRELTKFVNGSGFGKYMGLALVEQVTKYNESHKDDDDQAKVTAYKKADEKNEDWGEMLSDAADEVDLIREKIDAVLDDAYEAAEKKIADDTDLDAEAKTKQTTILASDYDKAIRSSVRIASDFANKTVAIKGKRVFASFLEYENQCLANAFRAVRYGNFTTGLDDYETMMNQKAMPTLAQPETPLVIGGIQGPEATDSAGFFFWILMAAQGLVWMLCNHWIFATLFIMFAMAVWALFGGAIYRIAALHAAREEKISIVQALRFSAGKFLNFFAAPLFPLMLILVMGGLLCLGGFMFGNLGGWGAWVIGLLLPLALLMGLAIAFLAVGIVGGCGLVYPTIAVEGSDAFDAISRSFSYVFTRPWRTAIYGMVALVYGTICYLFVKFFAFITLAGTHWFVKGGSFSGGTELAENADLIDKIWPAPTFTNFHPDVSWATLNFGESVAALMVAVWVYVVIGVVIAFALSFLASSSTVVYYLLRQKVDATDLDEVYVEEFEEELAGEVAETLADQMPEDTDQPEESGDSAADAADEPETPAE
ncbi:MAG: hypothetical protein HN350_06605 [Phycisphaerales bacterium]|jgi:hypothetical protein|nr:hypothetical protein [Phycisphaerales bacterium]